MSGASTSLNNVTFVAARVAGAPSYTPQYVPAGGDVNKPNRAMCTFKVFQNINGKPSKFAITAFGKMADVIARSAATGKELTLFCECHSYQGKIPVPNTAPGAPLNFITGQDGQAILVEKTGFILRRIHFGADSDKTVQTEIQNGQRPALWNVAGHADNLAWKTVCQQRNALEYRADMTNFGYAIVRQPNGQIVSAAVNVSTPAAGFQGTAQYNAAPVVPAAPVNVNGVNMGYQTPAVAPVAPVTAPVASGGFAM